MPFHHPSEAAVHNMSVDEDENFLAYDEMFYPSSEPPPYPYQELGDLPPYTKVSPRTIQTSTALADALMMYKYSERCAVLEYLLTTGLQHWEEGRFTEVHLSCIHLAEYPYRQYEYDHMLLGLLRVMYHMIQRDILGTESALQELRPTMSSVIFAKLEADVHADRSGALFRERILHRRNPRHSKSVTALRRVSRFLGFVVGE